MKYKLIATDFDGTLLNDKGEVSKRSKEVLIKCKEFGYVVVGITGRCLDEVKEVIDINFFDYLILNNGTYLYYVKERIGEYIGYLFSEEVFDITVMLDEKSRQIEYCSGKSCYHSFQKNKKRLDYVNYLYEEDEKVLMMNIFLKDIQLEEYYLNYINQKYFVHCFVMQDSNNNKRLLTVLPKGINKGITLKKLGEKLSIFLSEMLFFGDGLNDLEIMDGVGCSVAVYNAFDIIKEKANYITLSNNDDGVAVFLEKFLGF